MNNPFSRRSTTTTATTTSSNAEEDPPSSSISVVLDRNQSEDGTTSEGIAMQEHGRLNNDATNEEIIATHNTTLSDDDDVTVIDLTDEQDNIRNRLRSDNAAEMTRWNTTNDAFHEDRRRTMIQQEMERVQRANFWHFSLLCLVPTSLLLIVIVTVLGQGDDCEGLSINNYCANEPRSFIHAYTTRCICDAAYVSSTTSGINDIGDRV